MSKVLFYFSYFMISVGVISGIFSDDPRFASYTPDLLLAVMMLSIWNKLDD